MKTTKAVVSAVHTCEICRTAWSYSLWCELQVVFYHNKVLGGFPHQHFYLPHQPFGNCQCPTSVFPFSVTVRYGRATCQNHHEIYEAFATVSLWGGASHSHLFRGVLRFLARRRMRCCVDTIDKSARSEVCNIKNIVQQYTGLYMLYSDWQGVWIPKCPLNPHDRALLAWCPHKSHYLKNSPGM